MTFTSFAVIGALGGDTQVSASLGFLIAKQLLQSGQKVSILARPSSTEKPSAAELTAQGASVVAVDYDSPASLVAALKGVEVVISAIGGHDFSVQKVIANAAKEAGVQVFVPSEFGIDTSDVKEDSPLYAKRDVQLHLKQIGLPFVLFHNGPFAEFIPAFVAPNEAREIELFGKGETVVSFTALGDIASYLGHLFTSVSPSAYVNKTIYLQSDSSTLLSIAQTLQSRDASTKIVHVDVEEGSKRWAASHDFISWLKSQLERGKSHWKEEDVAFTKSLFPEWKTKSLSSFI